MSKFIGPMTGCVLGAAEPLYIRFFSSFYFFVVVSFVHVLLCALLRSLLVVSRMSERKTSKKPSCCSFTYAISRASLQLTFRSYASEHAFDSFILYVLFYRYTLTRHILTICGQWLKSIRQYGQTYSLAHIH